MNIVLVYNPKSGSALSAGELRRKCQAHGITLDALIAIDKTLGKRLAPYINKSAVIGVIGGDGTVSAVASFVSGTTAVLAPLPGGTLNHFTKDLGIPQDIDEAMINLASSQVVRSIDIGTINDTVFINNSSIGLYPSSLQTRNHFEDHLGKWPAAIIAGVRTIVRFHTYKITIGDETFRTPFVFVGNNKYTLSSKNGITRSRLDCAVLSIFIAHTVSRWVLFRIMLGALAGKVHSLDEFEVRTATSLQIFTEHGRLGVSHDGEVNYFLSPLQYSMRAGALKVYC